MRLKIRKYLVKYKKYAFKKYKNSQCDKLIKIFFLHLITNIIRNKRDETRNLKTSRQHIKRK